ncbi:MAG TPA: HAMP domain-containing sensor histidine kinase [Streptosporangiaceae bacterium]|jgi:signal transduction histidine kinase
MRLPIRLRLTLVFTLCMAVLLSVTGTFVYVRLGAELLRGTDAALLAQADAVAAGLGQQGAAFNPPGASPGALVTFTQVLGPGGRVLESSPALAGRPAVAAATLPGIRAPAYVDAPVPGVPGTARVVVVPQGGSQPLWVVAGTSSHSRDQVLSSLLVLMLIGGPVTLALAAAAGWAVAGAALRPVERMRQEADAISVSDRGRRLPIPASRDEMARLGATLNAMLGRLEAAFDRERRFVDDASHELRTPLAILKAELDLAQARPRTRQELTAAVRGASEEADRLTSLAETLLVYSRAEGGRTPLRRQPAGLDQLVRDACSPLAARAAAAGVTVQVDAHTVTASVDPVRVRQVVENLVSNALAYTPRGGQVRVSATLDHGTVCLSVQDTGPGFDAGVLPRVFEPFATGPDRPPGAGQGAGLGLAIVRAVAEAHGGEAVADNPPGGGARVTVRLPAVR